jgi:hypothetical protein
MGSGVHVPLIQQGCILIPGTFIATVSTQKGNMSEREREREGEREREREQETG